MAILSVDYIEKEEKLMEIHFYEGNIPDNIPGKETWALCHSWQATKEAISDKWPIIRTTQMGCMTLDLLDLGYRIFVHAPDDSQVHEVKTWFKRLD